MTDVLKETKVLFWEFRPWGTRSGTLNSDLEFQQKSPGFQEKVQVQEICSDSLKM